MEYFLVGLGGFLIGYALDVGTKFRIIGGTGLLLVVVAGHVT